MFFYNFISLSNRLCAGMMLSSLYYYLKVRKSQKDDLRASRVLEKAVRWIFERRVLNDEESDALLIESVMCGCRLEDLLERRTVLFVNEKRFPPGLPYRQFGLRIAYLYPYLPVGRQLLDADRRVAGCIYRFKEGNYTESLLDEFCELFKAMNLAKGRYMLVCIPASNMERMEMRYLRFSRELAARMEWVDGFGAILPVKHEQVHLSGQRRLLTEDDYLIDRTRLRGARVVLLDDLLTSGLTILSVKRVLCQVGAHPVAAVFVGRTLEKPSTWN